VALILGQAVQGIALDGARQTAYDDLHARLLKRISPQELTVGRMTSQRYRAFDAFIRGGILSDRTIRVKVWNRRGTVIYSDDPRISGRTFPMEGELSEALDGKLVSEVSQLSKSENRDDRRYGKLLEVYIPIQYQPGGQTLGAFEIYQTYGPVAREITSLQHSGYALLAIGLVILYLLLFGIVSHGSNTIVEQQKRLLKQALHDSLTGLPNRTLLHDRVQQAILQPIGASRPLNDGAGTTGGREAPGSSGRALRPVDVVAVARGRAGAVVVVNSPTGWPAGRPTRESDSWRCTNIARSHLAHIAPGVG
jgi:two-component system, NarL family, sensor kinase